MIIFKKFNKKYDDILFQDVDLSFPDQGLYLMRGDNGSGKTTLFKCLAGLSSYSGIIENIPPKTYIAFEQPYFYENLAVVDNVKLLSSVFDVPLIASLFQKYGIEKLINKRISHLSLGQRKLVMLIILELLEPQFIMFDEFDNGLDGSNQRLFYEFLKQNKLKTLLLLSSHNNNFENIFDEQYVIKDKKIIKCSSGNEVRL